MNPIALACVLLATAADPPKPTTRTRRTVAGWTVHLDDRLLTGPAAELGTTATGLLEAQLRMIAATVPADRVADLRAVPIRLDLTHGRLVSPQYHPSRGWLTANGYSPDLARCVHLPAAGYFAAAKFQREQPSAVLHELAHAYHDRVLGFEHPGVTAGWRRFVAASTGDVLHADGRRRPHYGRTNAKEWFAEMTESYLGRNDFYPFNAAELRQADPEAFRLMEGVWGKLP